MTPHSHRAATSEEAYLGHTCAPLRGAPLILHNALAEGLRPTGHGSLHAPFPAIGCNRAEVSKNTRSEQVAHKVGRSMQDSCGGKWASNDFRIISSRPRAQK